jgi:hypothetical protein
MSFRTRLVLPVILSTLAVLAGCGSSSNKTVAPPTGAFSDSNLKGTYVFSVVGSDSAAGNFLAMTGTLTADGRGNVTGGTFDLNNPHGAGVVSPLTISSGSKYSVTSDGRGIATLNTSAGAFGFDFVLSSNEGGQITEFDPNGSGSGTLDLQSTVAQADIVGSYAFNLTGTSGVGSTICGFNPGATVTIPLATVGAFTLGNDGSITAGVEDINNNCFSVGGVNGLAISSGSVNLTTGKAILTSSAGTFNFDVFPINSSHLKFIETDSSPAVVGDAFTQTSSIPAGNNVFTIAGFDSVAGGPFTAAGIIDTDGSGSVKSDSVEDINDFGVAAEVGTVTGSTISGNYTALSGGRSVLTLTAFVNGNNGSGCTSCQFAVYPSSGGLQLLEIDGGGTTSGIAYLQGPSPTLASGQGYGMNLSGANFTLGAEEDDIAEFTNNNGTFTGRVDFNDQGSTSPDLTFSSAYSADSTVPGRGTVTPSANGFDLVTYVVNSSTVVFVETDSNQVALGSFAMQNSTAKANAAVSHLAVLRARPGARKALKRH